jgi:tRNA A-37 threonylcarbamoyl transferase component Bud32
VNDTQTRAERGVEYARVKSLVRGSLFGRPAAPLRIGRFTVLERLGQGGMSIVYAAYDDELDRKVALKLLRPEAVKHKASERLRREAQAIARLSHANVIPVYEVGEHDGRVFVAMEFVRGKTLRHWLDGKPHAWPDVEDVLMQAAAGLAAAHRAGIVHRDFKPDNVMVDDEGRVRVLDFGVAAFEVDEVADTLSEGNSWNARLTQDGAIVGTPVYMAPESLAGRGSTALSDQFSFCAVCFEALVGRRAFDGDSIAELEAATRSGVSFPADVAAPAHVRSALHRGLQADNQARFPDMDALMHALEPAPKRRWALPALAVAATASVAAAWAFTPESDTCQAAQADIAWSDAHKADARKALSGADISLAEWDDATQALDGYAAAWLEYQGESCALEESDEAALERALCFEWLLSDLAAIAGPLTRGESTRVADIPRTVNQLPNPSVCLDDHAMAELGETRRQKSAPSPEGLASGLLSNFEETPISRFGAGWGPSTDVLAGGQSSGELKLVEGGHQSDHALLMAGEVRGEGPPMWSGAMVFLGEQHFAPANLQAVDTLTFWANATPGHYAVMVFSSSTGFDPALVEFELDTSWKRVEVDLDDLLPERYDVTGVFIGRVRPGVFELRIDDVGFE